MKSLNVLRSLAAPAAALVFAAAMASPARASHSVAVNVWVQDRDSYDGEVWIQFAPEREAYVALYGVFSDGRVAPVFPSVHGRGHWVDSCSPRVVTVHVPRGVRLESVQAFASCEWFDPWDCWEACAPSYPGDPWRSPMEIAVAYSYPISAWSFSLHWDSGWGRSCHAGHRVRCDSAPRRLVVTSGGCRMDRHSDWKWKTSDSASGSNEWRSGDRNDLRAGRGETIARKDRGAAGSKSEWASANRGHSSAGVKNQGIQAKGGPAQGISKSKRVSTEPKRGSRG